MRDLNNFLWLQKLKRTFNRKILYAISTDSCWRALCIFNKLFAKDGLIFSQASVCQLEFLVESSHLKKKVRIHPTEPDLRLKKLFVIYVSNIQKCPRI